MARYLVVALVALGCARVQLAGVDRTQQSATYCGNQHASIGDLTKKATEACTRGRTLTMLSCEQRSIGTYATQSGNVLLAQDVRGMCCEYQCR